MCIVSFMMSGKTWMTPGRLSKIRLYMVPITAHMYCLCVCKYREELWSPHASGAFHWTIWGISLHALAFFLARASQGGSSWAKGAVDGLSLLLLSFSTMDVLDSSREQNTVHSKQWITAYIFIFIQNLYLCIISDVIHLCNYIGHIYTVGQNFGIRSFFF